MKKHPLSALVFDFTLFPRGSIDSHHVGEIESAIRAGSSMPPLVIDKSSKRVADGFHRSKALIRIYGEDYEVECIEKTYKTDADLFLDAMRYNASHGRALSQHDKAHCLLLAEKLAIDAVAVSQALNLTSERMGELRSSRIGTISGRPIALKQTIRHMAGKELTSNQSAANDKLSGMNQMFYANQIITLIENDLLDLSNVELMQTLEKLERLLQSVCRTKAA